MNLKALVVAVSVAAIALPVFAGVESGLKPGERVTPFHPDHVAGPLAGTKNCFPCTFQQRPAVQVWVHGDDAKNVQAIIEDLQANMKSHRDKEFKALVVYVADTAAQKDELKKQLTECCASIGKEDIAIAVIDKDNEAIKNYKINLDASVKNTVFVYKDWKVQQTMVNLKMDDKGCTDLCTAVGAATK